MQESDLYYADLLRTYEETRNRHLHEQKLRQEEVCNKLPALADLDGKIAEASVAAARAALNGDDSLLTGLRENNARLSAEKQQLLVSAGYPADYLDLSYTCPDCKDTGFIGTERCHCFKQTLTLLLSKATTLPNILEQENFDTFSLSFYDDHSTDSQLESTPRENIKNVVAYVKDFVKNFDTDPRSLLIYGNTGVGKTFLTNCIAKELMETAHHVVYMTSHNLFETFEAHKFRHQDAETDASLYQYIFDCDLLIIDDLGTELSNSFTNSMLYTCINERQLSGKSTIISTNLPLEQLRDRYSERIFSRITGNFALLKIIGKDIRVLKRMLS